MGRVVIVSQRHDQLVPLIMKKVPDAVAVTNFKTELQAGDVLCWLPTLDELVDDKVQELVELIDHSVFLPAKIIMLSVAGTADDASEDQIRQWYGKRGQQLILAHQYAAKMIDELELPYTIIRTIPLTTAVTSSQIVAEGKAMHGQQVCLTQLAELIEQVVVTDDYRNQSIGLASGESEESQ